MSLDVNKMWLSIDEDTRWLVEEKYLPGAMRGDAANITILADVYDTYLNPGTPVGRYCPGCIAEMIRVFQALVNG